MALLPPSTNAQYRGAPIAAHVLVVLGVMTVIPACIHLFLPDGGAGVIAGIDLGPARHTIVALFAWAGATQLVFGLVMIGAGLWYRSFVPAVLVLVVVERGLHALNGWILKTSPTGHHPPEHYAVLVGLPIILIMLALATRDAARR